MYNLKMNGWKIYFHIFPIERVPFFGDMLVFGGVVMGDFD